VKVSERRKRERETNTQLAVNKPLHIHSCLFLFFLSGPLKK